MTIEIATFLWLRRGGCGGRQ